MRIRIILAIAVMTILSCSKKESFPESGIWRGVLLTSDSTEIPFNFEIKLGEPDTIIEIITGDYRYEVRDVVASGDSITIKMPLFSSQFSLAFSPKQMVGKLIRSSYEMPFSAVQGEERRFLTKHNPMLNVTGRWQIFLGDKELIGEFTDDGNAVTGSFLSPSGDYRFFEGVVSETGEFMMSCFDGGFIRLFSCKVDGDSLRDIKLHSGFSTIEEGWGVRNEEAKLPDAYSVTGLKKGYSTLGFSFPNLKGEPVSLSDERFKDRVTVVQISGSWCPNCLDESKFFMEMYNKYKGELEILCLTFERSDDFETAKREAMKLVDVAGIEYDVLITAHTPAKVKDALPELDNFKAFPTSLIIDKKGVVRRIHSGFSGPGTGIHYTNYVEEFTKFIESLIAE